MEKTVFEGGGTHERRLISWQPPPQDWVCLNTDGSVTHSPSSTAVGGIVRGNDGRFVRAFTMNLGGGSITRAELAGIVQGLKLAWELGARKVILQTDSLIEKTLIETASHHHPHFFAIAEIWRWLQLPWQVRIDHVFREGNYFADYLASIGHNYPIGVHVFDTTSSALA
ncbi:unnamed protein product [Linum tenue]|uniref:RNase H type-1 domain-containing protein n=1 Tax=Linum tenue TaxID=586396 RepID=A0AAV0J3U8_9ROSI|nr:unnamed protein product [Linum tenue]